MPAKLARHPPNMYSAPLTPAEFGTSIPPPGKSAIRDQAAFGRKASLSLMHQPGSQGGHLPAMLQGLSTPAPPWSEPPAAPCSKPRVLVPAATTRCPPATAAAPSHRAWPCGRAGSSRHAQTGEPSSLVLLLKRRSLSARTPRHRHPSRSGRTAPRRRRSPPSSRPQWCGRRASGARAAPTTCACAGRTPSRWRPAPRTGLGGCRSRSGGRACQRSTRCRWRGQRPSRVQGVARGWERLKLAMH